jgi:putative nucleotidyltransferase with HDIG domain
VCDAFVAIATDRPHRRGVDAGGALELIVQERGGQFDPEIVDCLVATLTGKDDPRSPAPRGESRPRPRRAHTAARSRSERGGELRAAIVELDVLPVAGPAYERALAAASNPGRPALGEIVSAIESDVGLTVAVLRLAQGRGRAAISGVAMAVSQLGPDEIYAAIAGLPRLSFPWQTSLEALLHRCAVHAQAVARSADRLSQMLRPFDRDDVVAAALLHDVGKLLLARIWPDFPGATPLRNTPEELVARERRELGYDHATLGALLMERWRLPSRLMRAVSAHHSAHRARSTALRRQRPSASRPLAAVYARERDPGAAGGRYAQRGDRTRAAPDREHGPLPPAQHIRQAGGSRPRPGRAQGHRDGLALTPIAI